MDKGEEIFEEFKKFWYFNQKQLGDIIEQRNAYQSLTTTLNNLGLIKKAKAKYNEAAKYLKQTLDLERAAQMYINQRLNEMNALNIPSENPYANMNQYNQEEVL